VLTREVASLYPSKEAVQTSTASTVFIEWIPSLVLFEKQEEILRWISSIEREVTLMAKSGARWDGNERTRLSGSERISSATHLKLRSLAN